MHQMTVIFIRLAFTWKELGMMKTERENPVGFYIFSNISLLLGGVSLLDSTLQCSYLNFDCLMNINVNSFQIRNKVETR